MHEIVAKLTALNQGGYLFVQTVKGDIFLYNSKVKLDIPHLESMDFMAKEEYELILELIYNREKYEQSPDSGSFFKTIKLKEINSIRRLKDVKI